MKNGSRTMRDPLETYLHRQCRPAVRAYFFDASSSIALAASSSTLATDRRNS
jgi:hypothetical protein